MHRSKFAVPTELVHTECKEFGRTCSDHGLRGSPKPFEGFGAPHQEAPGNPAVLALRWALSRWELGPAALPGVFAHDPYCAGLLPETCR